MTSAIFGFFLGVLASLIANMAWEYGKKNRSKLKRFSRLLHRAEAPPAGFLTVGKTVIPWVVCAYGPYSDEPVVVGNVKTTLRKRYAERVDLMYNPVPEFATHFGVGIMVVTGDGKIVFSERGPTAVDAFVFFPTVAEGASRPVDADPDGRPDPYRTATRGLAEELGVDVPYDRVRFFSFGANAVICEYALCGVVYIDETEHELLRIRSLGVPKDKWENQKLHFVQFTPEAVATFMAENKPWSPFAVVCAVHALFDRFGKERLDRAFAGKSIVLSQTLPR